jgi:hypothetical protein
LAVFLLEEAAMTPQSPALQETDATSSPRAVDLTPDEARGIALDAYVYFYPLVTMDITRKQFTNIEPGKEIGKGPMNMFVHNAEYPPADFRGVVRPNFDTLYSTAWLDVTKEPMVVSAPDTGGRYYLLPMLDMWSDVFASPGWRTTGTHAANYVATPPEWTGAIPAGFTRLSAPTRYVWVIGRTKTDGPQDYEAVHRTQAGFTITPLSRWGKTNIPPGVNVDSSVDMKTPPKTQVDTMSGQKFFAYAAGLLKANPPHATDEPIIARLHRIGIVAGRDLNYASLDPMVQQAIAEAPEASQALMKWKVATLARVANGWSMNTDTMGVYGNDYLKRAVVAQVGLGANLPEDAIYPMHLGDANGKSLDGGNAYTIHFEKSALPPVSAFWSITLYDADGFQVANTLNRFALSSWMPFKYNADGSLELYFQSDTPGNDREANWLPAPRGPFNLTMRLYAPKSDALTGKWNPPAVTQG